MCLNIDPEMKRMSYKILHFSFVSKLPADWTTFVLSKPLVNALHVEEMHARQSPDVLLNLKLRETDGALVSLLLLLL